MRWNRNERNYLASSHYRNCQINEWITLNDIISNAKTSCDLITLQVLRLACFTTKWRHWPWLWMQRLLFLLACHSLKPSHSQFQLGNMSTMLIYGLAIPCETITMTTSSNENISCVAGLLCGEFTGHQWLPRTKASDAALCCFLWSYTFEQTLVRLVISDAIVLIMTSL